LATVRPYLFCLFALLAINACKEKSTPPADGKQLAELYCQGCHVMPDPNQLDKATLRNYVLPRMGYFMGIYPNDSVRLSLFEEGEGGERVKSAGIFPVKPALDTSEWTALCKYLISLAPDSLEQPVGIDATDTTSIFDVSIPPLELSPPSITLARFSKFGGLYLGDANTQTLNKLSNDFRLEGTAKVREGVVSMAETKDLLLLTVMGSFSPTDAAKGFLMALPAKQAPSIIIDSLQRPVHTQYGDLDGDGRPDAVICEFGKWTGSLSWWRDMGGSGFERKVLRAKPGALCTELRDWNKDGKPDIIALFGQGDEGLFLFENQGGGKFLEKRLLTFGSSWGSVSFQLIDMNVDGLEDVLYVCGDNADYPPILKPYHGIRVYLQQADGSLKEDMHLPLYGAYGAKAADFDMDGDLDIAAISFFPDYRRSTHGGFMFFEQTTPGIFKRSTIADAHLGRWIVMDMADYDQDGDQDLLLGSLAFEIVPPHPLLESWIRAGIPAILLRNRSAERKKAG
jgi:hypothetical protein